MTRYVDMDGYELQEALARRGVATNSIIESKGRPYVVTSIQAGSSDCRVSIVREGGRRRRHYDGEKILAALDEGRLRVERSEEDLFEGRNISVGFDKFMDDIVAREERAALNEEARLKAAEEDTWGRKRELALRERTSNLVRWEK